MFNTMPTRKPKMQHVLEKMSLWLINEKYALHMIWTWLIC